MWRSELLLYGSSSQNYEALCYNMARHVVMNVPGGSEISSVVACQKEENPNNTRGWDKRFGLSFCTGRVMQQIQGRHFLFIALQEFPKKYIAAFVDGLKKHDPWYAECGVEAGDNLLTIYHIPTLGQKVMLKNGHTLTDVHPLGDLVRPMMSVITDKGYAIINCHIAHPDAFTSPTTTISRLQASFAKLITPSVTRLWIAGDFNDAARVVFNKGELQVKHLTVRLTRTEPAPTCCSSQSNHAYIGDYILDSASIPPTLRVPSNWERNSDHEPVVALFQLGYDVESSSDDTGTKLFLKRKKRPEQPTCAYDFDGVCHVWMNPTETPKTRSRHPHNTFVKFAQTIDDRYETSAHFKTLCEHVNPTVMEHMIKMIAEGCRIIIVSSNTSQLVPVVQNFLFRNGIKVHEDDIFMDVSKKFNILKDQRATLFVDDSWSHIEDAYNMHARGEGKLHTLLYSIPETKQLIPIQLSPVPFPLRVASSI